MSTVKGFKNLSVYCTLLLLIVSNCKLFSVVGIQSYFEYAAYFLLLCGVGISFLFTKKPLRCYGRSILIFAVATMLLCFGIAIQALPLGAKLRLIATMVVFSAVVTLGEDYLNSLDTIRYAAYGIFAGTLITTMLCLITDVRLLEPVYEGFMPYGFTGGAMFKNFYAAFLLGSFMGLFFYRRHVQKLLADTIIMGLEIILLFFTCARGTYVFFLLFLVLVHLPYLLHLRWVRRLLDWWHSRKKAFRFSAILVFSVVLCILIVGAFLVLSHMSSTYSMRYRGLISYWNYAKTDWFGLMFGNAATVWADPNVDYIHTLRDLLGWNTSFEMAFLATLIKNGFLGLIGFLILFLHVGLTIRRSASSANKLMVFSVMIVLLVSSFVESFATNIHSIFGVVCYLYMAGICGLARQQDGLTATESRPPDRI